MKTKHYLTLILIFISLIGAHAQLDNIHYLPPLKQAGNNQAIQNQMVYFSTPETSSFSVSIYRGTGTTAIQTITGLSKGNSKTYNPGNGDNNITLVSNSNTGIVLSNSGLRFESSGGEKFYVNYRGRSSSQAASLTCKGQAALGTDFRWGGIPNRGVSSGKICTSLGIIASEDNTEIVIVPKNTNCEFRLGNDPDGLRSNTITKTLNKGQSFVLEAIPSETSANIAGWIGSSITSTKPIAVSVGGLNFGVGNSGSRDTGIDQIVPIDLLGKEYVFIRGKGANESEFPVIVAYQNDTDVYAGGVLIGTINDGEYLEIPGSHYSSYSVGANMFVETSKEVYAYQCLAGQSHIKTVGMNFIAPLNCLLPSVLDEIPEIDQIASTSSGESAVTIIASTSTADANIQLTDGNGAVTLPASSPVAGTSDWKTFYKTGLVGEVKVTSTGPIAVGTFMRYGGNAGLAGYFSGFDTAPVVDVQILGTGCFNGGVITEMTDNFDAYQWYKDGVAISGENSSSYTPTEIGDYYVDVTKGTCTYSSNIESLYYCGAEVLVTLEDVTDPILEGDSEIFNVTVKNLSVVNITNLIINTNIHSNFQIINTTPSKGSWASSNWSIGTLSPGETVSLSINTNSLVGIEGGVFTSTVSNTQDQTDNNIELDDTTEDTTIIDGEVGLEYQGVFNDDGDGVSEEGEMITFTFTIYNNGETPLSNIVLTDPFLGGVLSGSYSGDTNNDAILDIGEVWTLVVDYPIISTDIDLGYTLTSATVSGTQNNNSNQTDDSDDPTDLTEIDDNSDGEPDDDTLVPLFKSSSIDFDGLDDYVRVSGVLNNTLVNSQMAWINLHSSFSNTGVVLGQSNNKIYVNSDNTIGATIITDAGSYSITSSESIANSEWTHLASISDGSTLKIFINGTEKGSIDIQGNQLQSNNGSFIIGKNPSDNSQYIKSFIQEVKVYDVALTTNQLREQIYQSIENNKGNVRGSIIPKNISGLSWSNLKLYLKMKQSSLGFTQGVSDSNHSGLLYNITTNQSTTAPLPYIANSSGAWTAESTWEYGSVWDIENLPNKDWAIVKLINNSKVTSSSSHTHLGLLIDSGSELEIENDQLLNNTSYVKLDGQIDLVGESQFIQTSLSDLETSSSGYLERDQDGESSLYKYNYWSSPVGSSNTTENNKDFTIAEVLRDGTDPLNPLPITFNTSGYDGATTSPITISDYWIFTFLNLIDDYDNWQQVRSTGLIKVGQGYTMKGTGTFQASQNYVFKGKPNNGVIQHVISPNNTSLLGNPYPSALDAYAFINDNLASITDDSGLSGALYFWEHWGGESHYLVNYQGGYATLSLAGGVKAVSDPDVSQNGSGTIRPGQYVPVGQGFFIKGSTTGGTIEFNNSQRAFKRESVLADDSFFIRGGIKDKVADEIKIERAYFNFTTPEGYQREILLALKENLSNNLNYGYDAEAMRTNPSDCFWSLLIEKTQDKKELVIKSIGNVYDGLMLPLQINTNLSGLSKFELASSDFTSTDLDMFLFDSYLDKYSKLEINKPIELILDKGVYENRFFVTFKNQQVLSNNDSQILKDDFLIFFDSKDESIVLQNQINFSLENLKIFNIQGKNIMSLKTKYTNSKELKIPVKLNKGIYILSCKFKDKKPINKKVVVY